ncbi:carboxypeptidase M32 [Stratiformator vulcanicus]|uniref:Metal-dependent carboxypeptidase n=1 Tax=Stratiformator vulcanicus TaxID=2527980 RepID=A0A517QZC7_9PLAN|nr:carboxypeptidase M32 [Stratiformator vulcanicus]QDT36953.1 Thermostable carboxypeptidase 1 [Stratiformator vulcanicus]
MDVRSAYQELTARSKKAALLRSTASVLGWEEQTYMPPNGAELRSKQLSLLAGLVHERTTDPKIGELLAECEAGDEFAEGSLEADNLREWRRDYDRSTKLPQRLVEEITETATLAQNAWVRARKEHDFHAFLPWLEKTVTLKREEADAVSDGKGLKYDALLDDYETGITTDLVAASFAELRDAIIPLVQAITESPKQADTSILKRDFPAAVQKEFSEQAAADIGFDFDSGRVDVAAHPFCSSFGPGDTRLTTRYDENFFSMAFFGTMHEAGHGIYEQNLPAEHFGTPAGESVSLGIHESQSLTWETFVGRSRPFWDHYFKPAQTAFPSVLSDVSLDDFFRAINDVRPSYIRVEADEVTYSLHILLRFELEQSLISGDLAPADVEAAWNEKFEAYFGFPVDHAANGCLQDIHWSGGLLGYFPTYALGKMYAAQLFAQARHDLGDLDGLIARGEFVPVREWLTANIHTHGRRLTPRQLIERVTGSPPSPAPLIGYLRRKFGDIYEIN